MATRTEDVCFRMSRRQDWRVRQFVLRWILCAALLLGVACGPNGAPVSEDAASSTRTPVPWQPVPTPTAGPPTAQPVAPPLQPELVAMATASAARPATVAPTATREITRPPVPTPTPAPPVQCRLSTNAIVAVQPNVRVFGAATPGTVPPFYRGTPGWQTLAAGEPLAGVHLELHLPTTTFVAGAVIMPEVWVTNTSSSGVAVLANSGIMGGNQTPIRFDRAATERSVLNGGAHSRPGPFFGSVVVPKGETWSFANVVQLPFDANQQTNVVAYATLGWAAGLGNTTAAASDFAAVPLKLTTAGPAQMLNLEAQADREHWCVRATTATGAAPTGPLFGSLIANAGTSRMFADPQAITGNTWAGYWGQPSPDPQSVKIWVGGQNYVTSMVEATLTSSSP